MLSVNDKVVYPGYGVARIIRVIERNVGGLPICFFELDFLSKDMTVLVPVDKVISVGVRPLCTKSRIDDILQMLSDSRIGIKRESKSSNWNKRSKDYQTKLCSGNLFEISKIYRDLKFISQKKELSFGEKSLLQRTEGLLAEEISVVNELKEDKAIETLRSFF
ncbi:hypothetical protein HN446_04950 [bacterium]|jgi:CarD family transcriptional regulator|nr:hypothetical protein [bacterium]